MNTALIAIKWQNDHLSLLDQRLLPKEETWLRINSANDCAQAITDMVVRGAPAIGISAAWGVVLSAQYHGDNVAAVLKDIELLRQSRPTAVNLFWALDRMSEVLQNNVDLQVLITEAQAIQDEDLAMNLKMAKYGADYIAKHSQASQVNVMTHCNTGALATAGHGTAIGVIRTLHQEGQLNKVYADETRPWNQGSRLTVWELQQAEINVTLNVEGAAALIMQQKEIDWIVVGADRVTANGDAANKIGTFNLAVLAKHFGVKMMVVAPSTTVDMNLAKGSDIEIEQRGSSELIKQGNLQLAPDNAQVFNPVFDVTPANLIDAFVSEKGVIEQPNLEKMNAVFGI